MTRPTKSFNIVALFHPTLLTTDTREATAAWFERVFGRTAIWQEDLFKDQPRRDGYSIDYSIFIPIQDVWLDAIDPARYEVAGQRRYPR